MNETLFPLKVYINSHPKGKVRVFIDGEEIYSYKNVFSCNIDSSQKHKIEIYEVPKSKLGSVDGLTVFEKNYSFTGIKKKLIINKPILLSKWSADFSINKEAYICIEYYKQFYTNYLGFRNYYYLGVARTFNGVRLKNINALINWSEKQKKLYYKLIHLKNSFLFLLSFFSFGYQFCEGLSIADEYIAASYTGYQHMIMSAVFLLCSIIAYVYFSCKLFSEYKNNTADSSTASNEN